MIQVIIPKFLAIVLIFFIISLLQMSFLPYFNVKGFSINLAFLLFFLLIYFWEHPMVRHTQHSAYFEIFFLIITAGFFLDMYSPYDFGISIVALFFVYCIKRLAIYFMGEFKEADSVLYFLPIFSVCFIVYNVIFQMASVYLAGFSVALLIKQFAILPAGINLLYHIIIISLMFYGYKKVKNILGQDRQLKLL